jgi:hypothetical protein
MCCEICGCSDNKCGHNCPACGKTSETGVCLCETEATNAPDENSGSAHCSATKAIIEWLLVRCDVCQKEWRMAVPKFWIALPVCNRCGRNASAMKWDSGE